MMKPALRIERVGDGPIVHAGLHASIGENIQGPSLIRVPDWVKQRLGKYYLYFADHKGAYIRLAYADELAGPWHIHVPGSLQLAQSHFPTEPPYLAPERAAAIRERLLAGGWRIPHDPILEITAPHIASPDVHVDSKQRQIIMYYHGLMDVGHQVTRVATSVDGVHFQAQPQVLGLTYWRGFQWRGSYYGLAMPGQFYRGSNWFDGFEEGPRLFNPDMRHCAVWVRGDMLHVFWTQVGDIPEHIKHSRVPLHSDWTQWRVADTQEVLRPERGYEGVFAPLEASARSTAYGVVNQLRDPAVYEENNQLWLLYAVGGEAGIGLARIEFNK